MRGPQNPGKWHCWASWATAGTLLAEPMQDPPFQGENVVREHSGLTVQSPGLPPKARAGHCPLEGAGEAEVLRPAEAQPWVAAERVRTRPGCLHSPCKAAPQNALLARNPAGCQVPPRTTCCLHESTHREAAQVLPPPRPEEAGSHPSTPIRGLPQVPRTIWQPCLWGRSSLPATPA